MRRNEHKKSKWQMQHAWQVLDVALVRWETDNHIWNATSDIIVDSTRMNCHTELTHRKREVRIKIEAINRRIKRVG